MSALGSFEDFVERTFEGSIRGLFRSPIQPAEIEVRLVREMEAHQRHREGRIVVPNRYRVQLHPADFQAVEPRCAAWEQQIALFVQDLCRERGYTLVRRAQVTITANPEVPRHGIAVEAALAAPTVRTGPQPAAEPDAMQPTAAMPAVGPHGAGAGAPVRPPPGALQFVGGNLGGTILPVARPVLTIGRELDNDLVVEDPRVSRHHAQLLLQHDRYVLRDLDSSNGTFVNGARITTVLLAPGDRLSFGGVEAVFRA